jgi:hypothetical protein
MPHFKMQASPFRANDKEPPRRSSQRGTDREICPDDSCFFNREGGKTVVTKAGTSPEK